MKELLYLAFGLLTGFGVCWFIFRNKINAVKMAESEKTRVAGEYSAQRIADKDIRINELGAELEKAKSEISQLTERIQKEIELRSSAEQARQQLTELESQLANARDELLQVKQRMTEVSTRAEEDKKNSEEKIKLVHTAREEMINTFKALSNEALKENNKSFVEMAGDKMINPVKETLSKVDIHLRELEKTRTQAYAGLTQQVKELADGQKRLNSETSNLVQALRRPEGRGRWGEMQLQRVAELAGMLEYCDFLNQETTHDDEGNRLRPDMIVKLPGGKCLAVDSKVPLSAYLKSIETDDHNVRESFLVDHARQVKEHFRLLGSKAYWNNLSNSPEFVVLFIPGEAFFSAALERDPEIIEYGISHNVIIATPTTLIAMLKAVAYGWRQEQIAENARKISDLGQQLYERISQMSGHLDDMRKGLDRAVVSYNKSVGSLESRIMVSARKFSELGVSSSKNIVELQPIDTNPRKLSSINENSLE